MALWQILAHPSSSCDAIDSSVPSSWCATQQAHICAAESLAFFHLLKIKVIDIDFLPFEAVGSYAMGPLNQESLP